MTPTLRDVTGSADRATQRAEAVDLSRLADPTLAVVLDEARQALSDAWDRREAPDHLLVHPAIHRLLCGIRQPELERGAELIVLGLMVTTDTSNSTEEGTPRGPVLVRAPEESDHR